MEDVRVLDSTTLKALAHPLRIRLLSLLQVDGSATATSLAKRLDETSGATSYHLRQLHAAGLVEEDAERGNQRERWWRAAQRGLRLQSSTLTDDPSTRAAADFLLQEVSRRRANWIEGWHAEAMEWPVEWRDASLESDWVLRLRPDQLLALREEVFTTIERYREDEVEDPADSERVAVIFHAFPQRADDTAKDLT